jgi:hypothetical protein
MGPVLGKYWRSGVHAPVIAAGNAVHRTASGSLPIDLLSLNLFSSGAVKVGIIPRRRDGNLMYPFWDVAVWPLIQAVAARRRVEIGALRGDATVLMLETLGGDTELHVIDPVPEFDPSEHERRFPGRYIFHRDLSRNVWETLPAVDVALVDGDHNWYTVDLELRMLAEASRRTGEPLPVPMLHDVLWPYGRRDLYYDPTLSPGWCCDRGVAAPRPSGQPPAHRTGLAPWRNAPWW